MSYSLGLCGKVRLHYVAKNIVDPRAALPKLTIACVVFVLVYQIQWPFLVVVVVVVFVFCFVVKIQYEKKKLYSHKKVQLNKDILGLRMGEVTTTYISC